MIFWLIGLILLAGGAGWAPLAVIASIGWYFEFVNRRDYQSAYRRIYWGG